MRTDQINVILLIALISWGTAQILKTLIHFIKTEMNFKAERLTGAGDNAVRHSGYRLCDCNNHLQSLRNMLARVCACYDTCYGGNV